MLDKKWRQKIGYKKKELKAMKLKELWIKKKTNYFFIIKLVCFKSTIILHLLKLKLGDILNYVFQQNIALWTFAI